MTGTHQKPHRLAPCGFTIPLHFLSPRKRGVGKWYRLIGLWSDTTFPSCRRGIARAVRTDRVRTLSEVSEASGPRQVDRELHHRTGFIFASNARRFRRRPLSRTTLHLCSPALSELMTLYADVPDFSEPPLTTRLPVAGAQRCQLPPPRDHGMQKRISQSTRRRTWKMLFS